MAGTAELGDPVAGEPFFGAAPAEPRLVQPFTPKPVQLAAIQHHGARRFGVLVAHRGFGKTALAVNLLLRGFANDARHGAEYAYVAPQRNQAERVAWPLVKRYTQGLAPLVRFLEDELRLEATDGTRRRLQLYGADNAEALRGLHVGGLVLDEFAQIDPHVWSEILRPALAVHQGFAFFIGTPKGRNEFHRLYERATRDPDWSADLWTVWRTLAFDPRHFAPEDWAARGLDPVAVSREAIESARRDMLPEEFQQEYECSFEAAIKGAYYATQLAAARAEGRIRSVPWDPLLPPVETWWDIGFSDATAVIFTQQAGRELRVIDYVEAHHQALPYYAKQLRDRPYLYARHHLPHDAGHQQLSAGGQSLQYQLAALGLRDCVVHQPGDPLAGIQQGRLFFARCVFDAVRCQRLLDALAAYRAQWDERRQEARPAPYHDWSSHGADAFRLLAVSRTGASGTERPHPRRVPLPQYAWTRS
jgi:phage terminase large subunit